MLKPLAVTISSLLGALAHAQCDPASLGVFDSVPNDFAVAGNIGYIPNGNVLHVEDLSDPTSARTLHQIVLPDRCDDVDVVGDRLVVSDRAIGLHFYDITDPASPVHIATYEHSGYLINFEIRDGVAFGADPINEQLVTLDVSDPFNVAPLALLDIPDGLPRDIDVADGVAALVAVNEGLYSIDVSDPSDPQIVGLLDSIDPFSVVFVGRYAYTSNGTSLAVVDLTDPASPQVVDNLANATSGVVDGDILYATSSSTRVIASVDDPASPVVLSERDGRARQVEVVGGVAWYVSNDGYRLEAVDVSDPVGPVSIGIAPDPRLIADIEAADGVVYCAVADPAGNARYGAVQIFDVSDPTRPLALWSTITDGEVYGVGLHQGRLYVGARPNFGGLGMGVYDVSDPADPVMLGEDQTLSPYAFQFNQDLVFIAGGSAGLQILDASDPTDIQLVGQFATQDDAFDLEVRGDIAYLTDRAGNNGGQLYVLDVSDPASPLLLSTHGSGVSSLQVAGDLVMVARQFNALDILDVSKPDSPIVIGTWSDPFYGDIESFVHYGQSVLLVQEGTGEPPHLNVLVISDPTDPRLISDQRRFIELLDGLPSNGIDIADGIAYVAGPPYFNETFGLRTFDFSGPCFTCPGDIDGDNDADADDFFAYLDAFATGIGAACDIDNDDDCDADDFFSYLDQFAQGC